MNEMTIQKLKAPNFPSFQFFENNSDDSPPPEYLLLGEWLQPIRAQ